jgi:hypothetical protein
MQYAMIWTTDKGYMPGTNGILNALEFYGFDIDTYVLTWGDFLSEEYKASWPRTKFIQIDPKWWPVPKAVKWYLRLIDVWYTINNLSSYDAILIWGADECPLNNFTDHFEIASLTNKIIVGSNEHFGSLEPLYSKMTRDWPYAHTWSVPYADIPFFISPKNFDVLEMILTYHSRDENKLSYMDALNYALRDLNKEPFVAPGELWVHNVPFRIPLTSNGRGTVLVKGSSTRMQGFHRKYWNPVLCHKYLPGIKGTQSEVTSRSNKMIFNRTWAWFNTEHRVKWEEGWGLWDGI